MLAARHTLLPLLATFPFVLGSAVAQVPEGHAIFGTVTEPGIAGTPGLFMVPLAGGPTIPVTGLPPELSTAGAYQQGTFGVSIRSSDGALIVSTLADVAAPTAGKVKLWVLHLNGAAVDPTQSLEIELGTAVIRALAGHALLPDDRVLVHAVDYGSGAVTDLQAGPMANHRWAIVDTSGPLPQLTLIPNPPGVPGQEFVTFDVDPTGRYAYYVTTTGDHPAVCDSTLLRLDLLAGTECQIASWSGESAWGVACDDDGTVYVSSTDRPGVQHFVHTVVPDGCNPANVSSVTSSLPVLAWGIDFDRAGGRFVVGSVFNRPGFSGPQLNRLSVVDQVTGETQVISQTPPGGYGTMMPSVAVNNFMDGYGAATDGQNRYWFENFPNPTGYPYVGNAGFSLNMASAPGAPALSVLGLSLGRSSLPALGVEIVVDPLSAVVVGLVAGTSSAYPLPIPSTPSLVGTVVTAQGLHLEANGQFAASRGIELNVQLLPAPTIASIASATAAAGATVTVDGQNFYPGMQLDIAGNATPIVTQTATTFTFVMPAGLACDAPLTLTNTGGGSSSGIVNASPQILNSTPAGPAAGGNLFVVSGLYMTGSIVLINGVQMTNILSQGANAIVGYAPPGPSGTVVAVDVLGPNGCAAATTYSYQ